MAEKLNFYRLLTHFRCIHPGSFFAELKMTTIYKKLPVAWGFLSPVRAPDVSPCGLINHFSHTCRTADVSRLPAILASLGVSQTRISLDDIPLPFSWMTALSDTVQCKRLSELWMIFDSTGFREHIGAIPLDIEPVYVPISHGGQYPGTYVSYTAARMMHLVKHLANGKINMVYIEIDCMDDEVSPGENAHQELALTSVLSVITNLTTFSTFNKSPRNMH
ncbi:putative RPA135-DNA-directed RNA polymerase I, 135 kd subunit [Dissophora ornata]|nr:putative RPA135-DNA-directed RNA polymerase I, 135 kd subunit [Dissophora ornata]